MVHSRWRAGRMMEVFTFVEAAVVAIAVGVVVGGLLW